MKSRPQLLLEFYSKFRGVKPTVFEAFARQPISYWAAIFFSLLIVGTYYYFARDIFALALSGVVVGGFARDIGWMLRFRRDWPTLDRVLDWQKIEQELSKQPVADS
jgi:hypothetical protein